jgi:hypothetical protein
MGANIKPYSVDDFYTYVKAIVGLGYAGDSRYQVLNKLKMEQEKMVESNINSINTQIINKAGRRDYLGGIELIKQEVARYKEKGINLSQPGLLRRYEKTVDYAKVFEGAWNSAYRKNTLEQVIPIWKRTKYIENYFNYLDENNIPDREYKKKRVLDKMEEYGIKY